MDVGSCLRAGTCTQCMLAVVHNADLNAQLILQASLYCIHRTIAHAFEGLLNAVVRVGNPGQGRELAVAHIGVRDTAASEVNRLLAVQIILLELRHDLLGSNLTLLLGNLLDHISELLMHALGQLEAVESIHNEGYAALSGLAVDADNRLVLPSNVAGIDRQIGNFPVLALSLPKGLHTLVDGILMGTGKCGKYQLSCIGLAGRNLHLGAALIYFCNLPHII